MNKLFIEHLIKKPHQYLLVWSFIYANSDNDDLFQGQYQVILSKFSISRTTLQRIVDYGCEYTNQSGQKVGRKWADKILTIKFVKDVSGQKVGRKRAVNNSQKENSDSTCYKLMVEVYNDFCNERLGMGAKIDAMQGKSMKLIISYLQSQILNKQGQLSKDELNLETVNAWKYILSHWSCLSDFYSQQVKLNQINSNLPNILTQIRKSNKKSRDEKFASTTNQIDGISFG